MAVEEKAAAGDGNDAGIEIRPLDPEDYDDIIRVWEGSNLSYRPKGRDSPETLKRQISWAPGLFLGAFDCEILVGVVMATWDGRKGWINRLAVLPNYRGKGVARRLIKASEDVLEKKGADIWAAQVELPNEVSVALFKDSGYVTHPDILYMTKRRGDWV